MDHTTVVTRLVGADCPLFIYDCEKNVWETCAEFETCRQTHDPSTNNHDIVRKRTGNNL
jgi:hypothetical protein